MIKNYVYHGSIYNSFWYFDSSNSKYICESRMVQSNEIIQNILFHLHSFLYAPLARCCMPTSYKKIILHCFERDRHSNYLQFS